MIDNYKIVMVLKTKKKARTREKNNKLPLSESSLKWVARERERARARREETEHECLVVFTQSAVDGARFLRAKNFSCTFTGNDHRVSLDFALQPISFDLSNSKLMRRWRRRRQEDNVSIEIRDVKSSRRLSWWCSFSLSLFLCPRNNQRNFCSISA